MDCKEDNCEFRDWYLEIKKDVNKNDEDLIDYHKYINKIINQLKKIEIKKTLSIKQGYEVYDIFGILFIFNIYYKKNKLIPIRMLNYDRSVEVKLPYIPNTDFYTGNTYYNMDPKDAFTIFVNKLFNELENQFPDIFKNFKG